MQTKGLEEKLDFEEWEVGKILKEICGLDLKIELCKTKNPFDLVVLRVDLIAIEVDEVS